VSGPLEFFTNKEATAEKKVDVAAPAFSLTKVAGGLGTLIAAIAVAAAKLEGATAVKVAAIGGGALAMVGYFGLAAIDLIVRQRAAQAKRRWPDSKSGEGEGGRSTSQAVSLVADPDTLVLQKVSGGDEYKIKYAEVEGDKVTLIAMRNGRAMDPAPTFHRP
jgi:hypothetical protein